MTQPQIRRTISAVGILIALACIAFDLTRGGPAFWPMLSMLGWLIFLAVTTELRDRRDRRA